MNARRSLYVLNRFLGDVNAVRRGRIWQRLWNRATGRVIGRATRGVWR